MDRCEVGVSENNHVSIDVFEPITITIVKVAFFTFFLINKIPYI